MKKNLAIILAVVLLFTQALDCFAAIIKVNSEVISNADGKTVVRTTVTSDVYSDLEDGKTNVTYSVYRDGNPITDFIFPTTASSKINTVSAGVYSRDYEYTVSKSSYISDYGQYSTDAKASYNNSVQYSNATELFSIPVNGVTLNKLNLVMQTGETEQLAANTTIAGEVYKDVKWTSNHPEIATVSNQGLVNAKASGTALIRATSVVDSAYYADCAVTVVEKKVYIDEVAWTKDLNMSRDTLNSIAYGNGIFVAVGGDGTIKTSTDAKIWTNRTEKVYGTHQNLKKVIWNGKIFVVIGSEGIILSSTDGIEWIVRQPPVYEHISDIAWNGYKFVAVSGKEVVTSIDGIHWDVKSYDFINFGLSTVVWHNNMFVACDEYGGVYTSTDGVMWYLKNNDMLPEVKNGPSSLASNGSIIVAVCNDGKLLTTTNLTTWSDNTPSYVNLSNVIWDGKYFLATGGGGNIIASLDGINWEIKRIPSYSFLKGLTYGNNIYVGVGAGGTIVISSDRHNWNEIFDGGFKHLNNIVNYGNKYFAVSDTGIYSSVDGVYWDRKLSNFYPINDMAWNGKLFIAVGYGGQIFTSTDGEKWEDRGTEISNNIIGIAWNGNLFVAVTIEGNELSSVDGVNWTKRKLKENYHARSIIWAGDKFIVGGRNNIDTNQPLLVSSDGFKWDYVEIDNLYNVEISGMSFNGKKIVAIGQGTDKNTNHHSIISAISNDAFSWTYVSDSDAFLNIIWDGKYFVSLGSNISYSQDGIKWITILPKESDTSNTLYGIAYNGSSYIAVGYKDTLIAGNPLIKVDKVILNKSNLSLKVNQTEQLSATISPDNATLKGIYWFSFNPNVAKVSYNGIVTAVGSGNTIIIAVNSKDKTIYSECSVNVSGNSNNNSSGGGFSFPTNTSPVVKLDRSNAKIEAPAPTFNAATMLAKVALNLDTLKSAIEQAKENDKGIKSILIDVPKNEGARSYETTLPAEMLFSSELKNKFEIKTEFGTLAIPSNMIKTSDVGNASNVSIVLTKSTIGEHPVVEVNLVADGKIILWNNSDSPVTVSIPYTPKGDEVVNSEHLVILYIDENGKSIPVPNGRYNKDTGSMIFKTPHFSKYAVSYIQNTFDDIKDYNWAKKEIEVLASKGVINGVSDKEYNPSSNITRADFLMLLMKTLDLKASSDTNFSDVNKTDYFYEAVGSAKKLGIVEGTGSNQFNPKDSISRQDMITMAVKALKLSKKINTTGNANDLAKYSDSALVASYAAESMQTMVGQELITGDGSFLNPLGNTTRAETAVLMYRIYNKFIIAD